MAPGLGEEELEQPGAVPARALTKVIDEASFSDDDVVVEYLGGSLLPAAILKGVDDERA